jgi:hypothetical protein
LVSEIGLGAVDADLTEQTSVGQLIERVVDGRERNRHLGQVRFLIEHFGSEVPGALAEQEPAQRHALPGRAKACRLQHLVDVMPRASGQEGPPPHVHRPETNGVWLQNRGAIAHFHFSNA